MASGAGGIGGIGSGLAQSMIDGAGPGANLGRIRSGGPGGGTDAADGADGAVKPGSFGEMLRGQLDQLSTSQADAEVAAGEMAAGTADDVARTMLRIESAHVQLQMATQVRNKVIEAYQEVLRMQI